MSGNEPAFSADSDHMIPDDQLLLIFKYLGQLEQSRQQQEKQASRKKIGFLKDD
jgi:hypothetical protein